MNQPDDRKTCSLCNRKFAQDRLAKHIEICKKQKEKKRNVFDSKKQRQILDTNDENAELTKPEKPASQPSSKPRTRIVKPVSRPAVKAAKKAPVKADETNEEPKTKATVNGGTTTKTAKSSQANGMSNATSNGLANGMTNGTTNGTSNAMSNGISNGKSNGQMAAGNQSESSSTDDTQGTRKATNGKKSQWRENHEEFVRSMQAAKGNGSLESSDEPTAAHKSNGIELADKESTITTNSESTSNTTASSTATINLAAATTNERNHQNDAEERPAGERPKPAPRKIQPPQSRLNKGKSSANPANAPQLTNGKQVNGQRMMNGASNTVSGGSSAHSSSSNGTAHNASGTPASTKKSINNSVECPTCGRIFNRAAGERHLPFCAEQQRKSSSNVTNQEALARFRARNAYRSTKGVIRKRDKSVPNEKKENYVRQSSLRRALSTIDGLDQVFNGQPSKEHQLNGGNSSSNLRKRSTSQGQLNRSAPKYGQPAKKLQINTSTHSKSSSASSKGSSAPNGNYSSAGYRETAQSRVKARLNQQQRLQKQRMNSNYPKTPIMKFKEKFPNHNNKLIEFADSQQFSQMFKHLNTNSVELNNLPKTVPGVRTGGLSPTKDIHRNGRHIEDLNDLEQLRAKIKEMYLSSNGNHSQGDLINLDYHLAGGEFETSFTRENSSKMKSSKSVNDFLALNDGFNDHLMNDLELPRSCHQCSTEFITSSARYCYSCGARRLGTVNSYLV